MKPWIGLFLLFLTGSGLANILDRQRAFLEVVASEKSLNARVTKAEQFARDKKSPYRIDAINYLIELKSSGDLMAELVSDPDVSEFAIYGVGELGVYEATSRLIHCLRDDSHNIRGNAYRSLVKLFPDEMQSPIFSFRYDALKNERETVVQNFERWWSDHKRTYRARSLQNLTEPQKKLVLDRWARFDPMEP